MKKYIIGLVILSLLYCGHGRVKTTSNTIRPAQVVKDNFYYLLWGAVPGTIDVDIRKYCGEGSSFLEAHYYTTGVGWFLTLITAGLVYPIELEVTCAR